MSKSEKPVVLTCVQPTGRLHIGNYLGAIKTWPALLDDYQCFFGIVDMHAITVPYDPDELRNGAFECLALYIACGLDPQKCNLFLQSHVTGHTELAWILGCLTPVGRLQRMTQFKDKSKNQGASVNSGLLYYPVLMAADILLYNADRVPVGADQKQHVEICRDIAQKFNNTYSETFKVPELYIPKTGSRVMSLQDPVKKMSKSDEAQSGVLYLLDSPKVLRKKIMSAVTDTGKDVVYKEDKPGIANLLNILSAATGRPIPELEAEFSGKGYGDFKGVVADAVIKLLEPIQKRYAELIDDREYLEGVLQAGAGAAQKRASKMLKTVYQRTGFVERPQ